MNTPSKKFDLKDRLIEKSVEAYVLALETINRLTIQYRLESFCFLFCNAWELLLKAKIITDSGRDASVFYKQKQGQAKRSLSLRDCLNNVWPNDRDPLRRNIERIEELRDESVHLVISQIPRDVTCLFQAGVINYHRQLNQWFGESLSERFPVGMMSIVFDRSPEQSDISEPRLQQQLGPDAASFLSRYCAEIKKEFDQLQRPSQFSIPIDYRLVLTKRADDADIALSSGPTNGEPTHIVEIAKDPSSTHPYRQKEVIEKVNEALQTEINQYDIRRVNEVFGVKANREYFYQGMVPGSPGQFSKAFVEFLIRRFRQDEEFFTKTREKAKAMESEVTHVTQSKTLDAQA